MIIEEKFRPYDLRTQWHPFRRRPTLANGTLLLIPTPLDCTVETAFGWQYPSTVNSSVLINQQKS